MSQLLIDLEGVTGISPQKKEKPKLGKFYLLTAVLIENGGLAFGGFEWHEKYIARFPEYSFEQEEMLKELIKKHQFSKGVIVQTGAGKRLKIGSAEIFFSKQRLATVLAKTMLENKVLPLLAFN